MVINLTPDHGRQDLPTWARKSGSTCTYYFFFCLFWMFHLQRQHSLNLLTLAATGEAQWSVVQRVCVCGVWRGLRIPSPPGCLPQPRSHHTQAPLPSGFSRWLLRHWRISLESWPFRRRLDVYQDNNHEPGQWPKKPNTARWEGRL